MKVIVLAYINSYDDGIEDSPQDYIQSVQGPHKELQELCRFR